MKSLHLTSQQYEALSAHLLDGTGKERVAFLLCGIGSTPRDFAMLAQTVVILPNDQLIVSETDQVTWRTDHLTTIFNSLGDQTPVLIKFHNHPSGYENFSSTDDISDHRLAEALPLWVEENSVYGSGILLPDGAIKLRVMVESSFEEVHKVLVVGSEFKNVAKLPDLDVKSHEVRTSQVFGRETLNQLKNMKIGVVGCSGTGSLVVQQLFHHNVGALVLVDHETIEPKNLNRVVHATSSDARERMYKVDVAARYGEKLGMGTLVEVIKKRVQDKLSIDALKTCDLVIGCIDSAYARFVLNRLATWYVIPYIDVGVRIDSDGEGGISSLSARADYLVPGESLIERHVISKAELESDMLRQTNHDRYDKKKKEGYIRGFREEVPAVMNPNSFAAALGINEFLSRLHSLRYGSGREVRSIRIDLMNLYTMTDSDRGIQNHMVKMIGKGDSTPTLGINSL